MKRKITSLTAFFLFIVLVFTSLVLYVVPPGRISYWSDWHFWGLTKSEWANLHINIGYLFVLSMLFHVYYNWKALVSYMKNKLKKSEFSSKEMIIALLVLVGCMLGTYFQIPPLSWILDLDSKMEDAAAEKYGEPPYGHAELSTLKTFSSRVGLDVQENISKLNEAGISLKDENQTILEISQLNNLSPKQLYSIIKPIEDNLKITLPKNPPSGFGKRPIADIAQEYSLNISKIIGLLAKHKIKVQADMSLKEIEKVNNINAEDVYFIIRDNFKELIDR